MVDAPRQERAESTEDHDRDELEHRERVVATVREGPREQELAQPDGCNDQRGGQQAASSLTHPEADAGEEDGQ